MRWGGPFGSRSDTSQRLKSLLKKLGFRWSAPKGASDFEELTASLKRCPDTKREFFQQTVQPQSKNAVIAALKRCATQNKLPLAVRVGRVILPSDLIAFVMHNENHAHGCECGRNDKDQNAALQRCDHASASGSRLGITERAALRKSGRSG